MTSELQQVLSKHAHDASRLLQILRDLATPAGHVPPKLVTEVSAALRIPRAQVEGVVGFYSFLSSEDTGRYRVLFSDNITDQMAGGDELLRRMLDAFRVELGEVSHDGLVSIDRTSCTGLCDQGPALLVNGRPIPRLTPARIGAICSLIRGGSPVSHWPSNLFTIHSHIYRRDLLLNSPIAPGQSIRAALTRGRSATLSELQASNLRGRGGAGYLAGDKWKACALADGTQRAIVCNADEGEPGTFKDRELLTHMADQVIEGMTVAAYATGAQQGFIYLRAEYPFLLGPLRETIERRREQGLLGANIHGEQGFDFELEVHVGAGAYICGEESALLESLEGRRGIPRRRPPYPVTHGYKGWPTVVSNVETFAAAAYISAKGAASFRAVGTASSSGTKVLSVSGDVLRPGVYEFPFGVSIRSILAEAGAENVQAVQVGGPSGVLLTSNELDRKLAFEDVPSSGALMVFSHTRDILGVVANFARFFAHESCGFCTPCRVGTTLHRQLMARVACGKGSRRDLDDLLRVSRLMRASSHCGLGTTASNPIVDAIAKFRPTFDRRLVSLDVLPAFDLDESLAPAREATARDDALAHFQEEHP